MKHGGDDLEDDFVPDDTVALSGDEELPDTRLDDEDVFVDDGGQTPEEEDDSDSVGFGAGVGAPTSSSKDLNLTASAKKRKRREKEKERKVASNVFQNSCGTDSCHCRNKN